MSSVDEVCRLCLRTFARVARGRIAITNEVFQPKLQAVFPFPILPTETLPSDACRGCRVMVEQFFEYSEKVRSNQADLDAALPNNDEPDSVEEVKAEFTDTAARTLSVETDSVASNEHLHIELLKVEPLVQSAQREENAETELSEHLIKSESNESLDDDFDDNQVDALTMSPNEQPWDSPRRKERKALEPVARKKKRPRAEDEILLREHFHLGCEMCTFMSDTVPDLFQHYRQEHKTAGYIQCCNRKFFRRARLLEHLGAHLGSIVCDICGKVFRNTFSLDLHKLDHEAPDARQFKCDQCSFSFHKLYHLKQHQKRHERVRCTICDKVLAGENGLKGHMQKMHGNDNKQICPTCGKEFRCSLAMERHIKAHLGLLKIERVQCDRCDKWFGSKLNLRNHFKRVHDEAGPIQCDECQHVSPNRRALHNHKVRAHGQKQSYECEYCGKKLNTKLTLKEHLSIHTNIPLYSCEFCGITFNSNANKYVHRKSKHPKEWEAQKQQKLLKRMSAPRRPLANNGVRRKKLCTTTVSKRKMNEKCRLCLGNVSNETQISIRDAAFHVELKNVFHFEIGHDLQLPQYVCGECRGTVAYIDSYCQQVQNNQAQLIGQAKECILQPVENVKVESLHDADCFEAEENNSKNEPKFGRDIQTAVPDRTVGSNDEKAVKQATRKVANCVDKHRTGQEKSWRRDRRNIREKIIISRENTEQDSSTLNGHSKQLENDQLIKDFFTLECEICSAPLESFVMLLDHYRCAHDTRGYVRCCGKQFFRRYILVDHIAAHRGSTRCEICQKTYKTKRYLMLHIAKSHSSEEERPFKCAKCHISYPKQYLLRAHELLHVQQQCHICQKVLSNNQSLKVHLAQMHSDDGNHICDTCGKVFRTKPAMERHINEHQGLDVVERLQCEHCHKWFSGKYNLNKHVRFLHMQDGQVFRCDVCQHVSPNSRALANHKLRIHVEERFECEYCGKRFKRRPNLREHIATHTNVPLYSCEICENRTFNSKANYFTHRKNKHPQEWEARLDSYS
uniref:Transcription factor grauzone n=1 Tax=Anopheles culicifacies TaxID=139723 RepID=A0A182MQT8_9DIPT